MPITSSAKKALRVSERKTIFNLRRKKDIEVSLREIKKLVKGGKVKEAEAKLSVAYKAIDKAVKTKFLKKNTAGRLKSKITTFINKAKLKK